MINGMRREAFTPGLLVVASLGLQGLACGEPSHVYDGRLFLEHRRCLGTTVSVDVVEGEPPGDCGPVCLAQPQRDGGRAIYVSRRCAPYPFGFDASGTDPACPEALAALERSDTCLVDGGSTSPPPPLGDAGAANRSP